MAHRPSRSDRYQQEDDRAGGRASEDSARAGSAGDTWLCRSTVGQDLSDMSDGDDSLDDEYDARVAGDAVLARPAPGRSASAGDRRLAVDEHLEEKRSPPPLEPEQQKHSGGRWPGHDSVRWSTKRLPVACSPRALGSDNLAAGSASRAGDGRMESDALESKPAAPPTPAGKVCPPPKLPRIAGWANADALRGRLPHAKRRNAPGAAIATVSVGREPLGSRSKSRAMRSTGPPALAKKQRGEAGTFGDDDCHWIKFASCRTETPGHRKRRNEFISDDVDDADVLADSIQRKIDSAEWSRMRDEDMKHRSGGYLDEPDTLADKIQQKIDRSGWGPPRDGPKARQVPDYFDETDTLADSIQQKIDRAAWSKQRSGQEDCRDASADTLADGIQQKMDREGWGRPREEATQGRVARCADKLDALAGKLQHKISRPRWTRRRNDAPSSQLPNSDTLADKIQRKIDREGWSQARDDTAHTREDIGEDDQSTTTRDHLGRPLDGSSALADRIQRKIDREGWRRRQNQVPSKRPLEITADTDALKLKPTRQQPSDRKLSALTPLAPDVTVGVSSGLPPFAEKTGDDQVQRKKKGEKPRRMDILSSPSELKIIVENGDPWAVKCGDDVDSDGDDRSVPESPSSLRMPPSQNEFRVGETLTHLIVFASTATLHCGVFTFSVPVRHALSLEAYPFGIVLLVCWAIEGLARCVGGVLGDLVVDRIALLRRAVLLWTLAVLLLVANAMTIAMADTSAMSSVATTLSSLILLAAFLFGGGAHGMIVPNLVALGAQSALHSRRAQASSLFGVSTPKSPIPHESLSTTRIFNEDSDEEDEQLEGEQTPTGTRDRQSADRERGGRSTAEAEHARLCVNRYYSASFAATTAGSSIVQVFFFVFAEDLSAIPTSASSSSSEFSLLSSLSTSSSLRGIIFLGVMGAALIAALGAFMYQSRGYSPPRTGRRLLSICQRLRRSRASHAAEEKTDEPLSPPSVTRWLLKTQGTSLVVVGYALMACTVLLFAGSTSAVVILAVFPESALAVRLSPFLAVMTTWLVGMAMASRMLKAVTTRRRSSETKEEEEDDDEADELPEEDVYERDVRVQFGLVLLALGGALACAAFVRGQLYSTVATQLCQTNVELPSALVGSMGVSVRPEVAGGAVGLCSVLLLVVVMQLDYIRQACTPQSKPKTDRSWWSWLHLASTTPATRMAIAAALSLVGLFLASVVELYRRHAPLLPIDPSRAAMRQCVKPVVDLSLLWSTPALVVLGVADALFRVSLHEQVHVALLQCHDAGLCNRWAGRVLGALALAEALGNAAALALVAALASWLLGPTPSDLTLVFLLLTTALALTFVMLKSIGKRVARVVAAALRRATHPQAAAKDVSAISVVTPPPVSSSLEFSDEAIKKLMAAGG